MTNKLITTKVLEIPTDMKNQIVENAIHVLKELENKREPLEKVYNEKKAFIKEIEEEMRKLLDDFEPVRSEYEGYDESIARQERIIDLYSRGKSKEEVRNVKKPAPSVDSLMAVDSSSINAVPPLEKNKKQITWMDLFYGYLTMAGHPLSFTDLWECFLKDASEQHKLIVNGNQKRTLNNKLSVARNCQIHAERHEQNMSIQKNGQKLYFARDKRVDKKDETYWIHPRK